MALVRRKRGAVRLGGIGRLNSHLTTAHLAPSLSLLHPPFCTDEDEASEVEEGEEKRGRTSREGMLQWGVAAHIGAQEGSVVDQSAVRTALGGTQAVVVTGRLGSLAQLLQGSKVEHVVLVSQVG
ncbi:unnamed protein product [Closterium sp. NIES-64]|nr:unnamed protein product [Closterium sp. NIES-64]